ncbi:uncharacterized protein LOC118598486 [Oryzias melastigma]|uniref:uncharacterized protein LOC118598486 n=1 Tax=Oryzias melastigma TaxID=30732 RepID=UPI00168D0736|nr:uncharacterized protein LOC118598486 [Oryzias melastigma]
MEIKDLESQVQAGQQDLTTMHLQLTEARENHKVSQIALHCAKEDANELQQENEKELRSVKTETKPPFRSDPFQPTHPPFREEKGGTQAKRGAHSSPPWPPPSQTPPFSPSHHHDLIPGLTQVQSFHDVRTGDSLHRGPSDRELDKISRNLTRFEPTLGGSNDPRAYLDDIKFYLRKYSDATIQDKIYLIKLSSSREVIRFIERQPEVTRRDWFFLRQAIEREFSDYTTQSGLIVAMSVKQGRHEPPQHYYYRLFQAYFGTRNEPGMEEDLNFKSLFLQNLHPGTSHHLGVFANPHTATINYLRELAALGFQKQKQSNPKSSEPTVLVTATAEPSSLELEGAPNPRFVGPSSTTSFPPRTKKDPNRVPSNKPNRNEPWRSWSGKEIKQNEQDSENTSGSKTNWHRGKPQPKRFDKTSTYKYRDRASDITLISSSLFDKLRNIVNNKNKDLKAIKTLGTSSSAIEHFWAK